MLVTYDGEMFHISNLSSQNLPFTVSTNGEMVISCLLRKEQLCGLPHQQECAKELALQSGMTAHAAMELNGPETVFSWGP